MSEIEKTKIIELIAIGIGHDVSKYYSIAFTIDDVDNLTMAEIRNILVKHANSSSLAHSCLIWTAGVKP